MPNSPGLSCFLLLLRSERGRGLRWYPSVRSLAINAENLNELLEFQLPCLCRLRSVRNNLVDKLFVELLRAAITGMTALGVVEQPEGAIDSRPLQQLGAGELGAFLGPDQFDQANSLPDNVLIARS